jgi:pseudomonalisin
MLRTVRLFLFFAVSVVLLAFVSRVFAQGSSAGPQNRIRGAIVESEVVTLVGNVHPLARAESDRGEVEPETRLERMVLVLQPSSAQQKALDALTTAQQNPGSPLYHQWLTPAEYGARFGVSPGDLVRTIGWLQGHGFTVEPVPAGRRLILFSGTAGQVEETFHTQMHRYVMGGESHLANSQDPQIPKALSPMVAGLLSLHDFRRASGTRSVKAVASPENTQGGTHYLFPADLATIYDLKPLYAARKNGGGATIAIVGRSNINLGDVSSFRSYAGLTANQPTVILDGVNPGLVPGDQDESTLDVEWAGGIGAGASVKFVVAKSTSSSDGVDLSAQYIVNNKTASVMSTSYGSCEVYMGSGEMAFYNSLWQQAASEGISSFVSSGDSGAAGCNGGSSSSGSQAGVNGLCSSPYATCVGGTQFNEGSNSAAYWGSSNGAGGGSALSYIPEKVWNESASAGGSGLWSSGGGVSRYFTQPTWQAGVSGASSNGMRAVPDVSLTAASHDGYLICENGSWYVIAGTSASSPSFAGIMSIVVQKQNGVGQGNANPRLYGLLSASVNPFHATPSGNNSVPGVSGFTASGAAYNLATGLGSVDANLLVNAWPASGGTTQPGFTLAPSVSSLSVQAGKTASFSVAVAATGGFSGSVTLTATAASGVSVTFSPASVTPGSSATATVTALSSTAAGASSIAIKGTSAAISATASVALTIQAQAAATFGVSAAVSKVTIADGKTATLLVITTTGGSFTGTVALAVTGLPTGVSATWSANGFKVAGVTSTNSTLTFKATGDAALNTASLTITAAGGGLQAKTYTTLQVTSAPGIKLGLSAMQIQMKSNGTQQVTVTATPQGGVTAAANMSGVSFNATGLPTGITASWGTPALTANGAVQVVLTLTGSAAAAGSNTTVFLTGSVKDVSTGTIYSASQQAYLSVTRVITAGPLPIRR